MLFHIITYYRDNILFGEIDEHVANDAIQRFIRFADFTIINKPS